MIIYVTMCGCFLHVPYTLSWEVLRHMDIFMYITILYSEI